ncbi:MAG: PEGA domain-containing protein [Planctomycetes bacterium]|nr:PEGA domain-containing protein [Planctomycetota bacterium]
MMSCRGDADMDSGLPREPAKQGGFPVRVPCTLGAMVACVFLSGCFSRVIEVRSNPEGAVCYIDGEQVGVTPVEIEFVHYGPRQIRLSMDGYLIFSEKVEVDTPWYEVFPLDFFVEHLVPFPVEDRRVMSFDLVEREKPTLDEVEEFYRRAGEVREEQSGAAVKP